MSTTTITKTAVPEKLDARVLARISEEGYGPGAWHGADLKAALADVSKTLAFWRPAAGRHNIAEIAIHHAYATRAVRGQLAGSPPEPFLLEGEDWFALNDESALSWSRILAAVNAEQERVAAVISETNLSAGERFDLILGITCHAVYHAGQVQLIKRLAPASK
jgi:hypothetical protein